MRDKVRIVGLLAASLVAISASGQTVSGAAVPAVPILQAATLPVYPPIAKAAHITGKVNVRVVVEDGLVVKTEVLSKPDVSSNGRFLESPTVENLKSWRFATNVTGEFTVTYTYEISGTETDDPTNARVEMLPTLDVKIVSRPVKPTVMYQKQSSPSVSTSLYHEAGHTQGTSAP